MHWSDRDRGVSNKCNRPGQVFFQNVFASALGAMRAEPMLTAIERLACRGVSICAGKHSELRAAQFHLFGNVQTAQRTFHSPQKRNQPPLGRGLLLEPLIGRLFPVWLCGSLCSCTPIMNIGVLPGLGVVFSVGKCRRKRRKSVPARRVVFCVRTVHEKEKESPSPMK